MDDGMDDAIAGDRRRDVGRRALGGEFRRVDSDDDDLLGECLLDPPQSGRMCMQLMQQKVQKSRMTSLPRSAARVSGASTLNQARPGWSKSGARTMPVMAS